VIDDPSLAAAALFAHRNILFGARAFHGYSILDVCDRLVETAVREAEEFCAGEQVQAMANLRGLTHWVSKQLQEGGDSNHVQQPTVSETLKQLQESSDPVPLEAVRAIATGIPRPGHSVVGQGTFRDGEEAWKALAREFIELGMSEEANLYQKHGGRLVTIEHLADTNPKYLKTAGGAMARFFIL